MVILDLNEDKKITIKIIGNMDEFHSDLNFVKTLPDAEYDGDNKVWLIPRNEFLVSQLEQNLQVAYKKDKETLLNKEKEYVKTGADDMIKRYGSVNKFISHFGDEEVYQHLFDFQKLGVASALYNLGKSGGFLIGDDMGAGEFNFLSKYIFT